MNPELAYLLKVNVGVALFYVFYRLFFHKDTFFRWRRIALLGFVAVSLLYPVADIGEWIKQQPPMLAMVDLYSSILLPEVTAEATAGAPGITLATAIPALLNVAYWTVFALLLIQFFVQLAGIIKLGINTPTTYIGGTKVNILTKPHGPFSFFGWIFVHPASHTEAEMEEILTHELTHVRQWHSVDVVLSQLMCVVCWFNPFVWLLKREIRNNLEYLADHEVLENGYDYRMYQYHLLGLAHQKSASALSNNFNILPLKNRIRMMNKKRTKQIQRTKYLLFVPLAALLLLTSNIEVVARTTKKVISEVLSTEAATTQTATAVTLATPVAEASVATSPANEAVSGTARLRTPPPPPPVDRSEPETVVNFTPIVSKDDNTEAEDLVFEVVEKMPQFPEGQKALMQHLTSSLRYPASAIKQNIQGRVIIQFVVDKKGNIANPVVVRPVSPEIDAEALRVISSMPRWEPGEQRGKPVNVKYTVPVVFRLQ